ncbi:methyltransferase-domain-containing protein [Lasiosphaeria miniovina]|uniref:Ribosomal RNA-processing protein 8 n=1 Tax=Lasiosphaeria miniovina TaxID=1954250 RepID=A0AA40ALX1_9PEZI|nr:methyltransferase-domain-containing protein [Lasiosphaeria miniovina]KAK0718224.1 methyltransferase-domain-containing protein [Lasiosphaeria miniovina]
MFPVKGWSMAAEAPMVEKKTGPGGSAPQQARKRKRPGQSQPPVTTANLADLWEKVIEHKGRVRSKKGKKGGRKTETDEHVAVPDEGPQPGAEEPIEDGQLPRQQGQADAEQEKNKKNKNKNKNKNKEPSAEVPVEEEKPADADGQQQSDNEEWGGIEDSDDAVPEVVEPVEEKNDRKSKKQKTDDTRSKAQETKSESGATVSKDSKKPSKDEKNEGKPTTTPAPALVPVAEPKLTPLQASMRQKLVSARFRHLNETLYTRPSVDAFQLFQESPEMFSEYHEGFRRQVEVWPENPVDSYIRDVKARAKVARSAGGKHDFANPASNAQVLPLPRTGGKCTIADLGCGDAALARALEPVKQKLHLEVLSYDLQTGGSPLVTPADIANLPLRDRTVDVAVFCLALMGTNWLDFIDEAYRILRWKGELWVAEIKSRFAAPNNRKGPGGPGKVVAHSVGNRKKAPAGPLPPSLTFSAPGSKKTAKGRDEAAEAAQAAELEVAVDGAEKQRQETDIAAFVEALRKRGFALHKELGDGAADLSNRMFVKMLFVKAMPAIRGKYAVAEEEKVNDVNVNGIDVNRIKLGRKGPPKKQKFIDEEDDGGKHEVSILKPCVYKLR